MDCKSHLIMVDVDLFRIQINSYMQYSVLYSLSVYRLDLEECNWIEVNGIGPWTFFIGDSCYIPLLDYKGRIKQNSIYLTDVSPEARLCCYDLHDESLTLFYRDHIDLIHSFSYWVKITSQKFYSSLFITLDAKSLPVCIFLIS